MRENIVTESRVAGVIEKVEYTRVGVKTTVCCVTLSNGFEVIGTSACVDPDNFNKELGEKYALEQAISKIEELEGYRLQSELMITKE